MKPLNNPVTFILFIFVDLLPGQDSVSHDPSLYDLITFADKEALLL